MKIAVLSSHGLRYFNVFGRRQDPNGAYAAVIPKFIKQLLDGETPTINGDGKQSREFNNHDDVSQLFAKGTTLESGRWGLVAMSYIFPDFSMPWIYGVISIVFITIAVCVIVRMFDIQNRIYQSLLAALIIACPSLIGVFTYMFTATSFSLS
jgi:hypothetical protein